MLRRARGKGRLCMSLRRVILVRPRGFCAGVVRAIDIVTRALTQCGPPIYVRKEIVHNRRVVEELRQRGALFVDSLQEVPVGALCIFAAHGVAPEVWEEARKRDLRVVDATCPLVTKVHREAVRFAREGSSIVLIGHKGHDEVIGTMGEAPEAIHLVTTAKEVETLRVPAPSRVAYLTQTTLSVDDTREVVAALRRRFPNLVAPSKDDICYATQNRQLAVKRLASEADLVLVIGAHNSSNSLRLTEVARECGGRAELIADASEIEPTWLEKTVTVGVTAGASAPEVLTTEVVERLRSLGAQTVEEMEVVPEDVRFSLPPELLELR